MQRLTALFLCLGLMIGCDMPGQGGDDPIIEEPPPPPPVLDPAGSYTLVSEFDLTVDAVLPGTAHAAVQVLADFRADPADTLFTLLDQAGVPLLAELLAVLPSALENGLKGWINDYINGALYQDQRVVDAIDGILALSQTVLTRFDLVSELELGTDTAVHRLQALRTGAAGREVEIAISLPDPAAFVTEAVAGVEITAGETQAQLAVGAHAFGLPYGDLALGGIEYLLIDQYGTGIRDTLGLLVNCPAMGASVANKCVLNVCVGHEEELTSLCEQGLDLVVDELRARVSEYRFDVVDLAAGQGVVRDSGTGRVIEAGQWDASINAGMGLRSVPARFTGTSL